VAQAQRHGKTFLHFQCANLNFSWGFFMPEKDKKKYFLVANDYTAAELFVG